MAGNVKWRLERVKMDTWAKKGQMSFWFHLFALVLGGSFNHHVFSSCDAYNTV